MGALAAQVVAITFMATHGKCSTCFLVGGVGLACAFSSTWVAVAVAVVDFQGYV